MLSGEFLKGQHAREPVPSAKVGHLNFYMCFNLRAHQTAKKVKSKGTTSLTVYKVE
jgi:hypothetical protein